MAAAHARGRWVKAALEVSEAGRAPTPAEANALAEHRLAFEELRAAYEGLRRMIERGYVTYRPAE